MKKSDKKLENNLLKALTEICEQALDDIEGFKWLTHQVSYNNFPASLQISCHFQAEHDESTPQTTGADKQLCRLIKDKLAQYSIAIKDTQVCFVIITP